MKMIRQFRMFGRPVQLLLLNLVVINTGFYMLMPYLSSYLGNSLGFTAWMVGLVLGIRTFSQQGLYVIGGTLSDHVGYKPVIAGGCALRMAGSCSLATPRPVHGARGRLAERPWRLALFACRAGVSRLGVR